MGGVIDISSASVQPVTTARIGSPVELIAQDFPISNFALAGILTAIVLLGFGLRVHNLSVDGLSEDEFNKLRAVQDYRQNGLTSANGEHPMLMKALLTMSIVAAERWEKTFSKAGQTTFGVPLESALRFPGVLFGALSSLLIFFVARELFGVGVATIAAALWALDPSAISFNRIAKEDTFLVFFFLLANVFWLRGQRLAETGEAPPDADYWMAAASFGAMVASKYIPHYLAISSSYYYALQGVPSARWRLGKRKWLIFFAIMGVAFLICNPTILLPGTWQEMKVFASERRIGHDAYEFMGQLYRNQMSLWLRGSPWYFYFVFIAFKTPIAMLFGLLCGLPLVFSKRLGDGRIFLLFWALFWFLPFTVLGGKFTRYYTFALPLVAIVAAIGINRVAHWIVDFVAPKFRGASPWERSSIMHAAVIILFLAFPAITAARISPYYRLYINIFGGGSAQAGNYFPHDEFYDGSVREAAYKVSVTAQSAARVASETPELMAFYLRQAQRDDLKAVSLSDKMAVRELAPGDIVVVAKGRRYFSNDTLIDTLQSAAIPIDRLRYGPTISVSIYVLDERLSALIKEASMP